VSKTSPPFDYPVLTTSLRLLHDVITFGATHMNVDKNTVLRLRICGHAACRATFTICVSCDLVSGTSKAKWAGSPIAVASSVIGNGCHNLP
jgi:hypothetical protein